MVKHGGAVSTKRAEETRKESQKMNSLYMKGRRRPIKGWIIAMRPVGESDYVYEVKVRPDTAKEQPENEKRVSVKEIWMPLAEDPAVIALLYGDKDLIINSRCRIEFLDATPRSGQVFIEFDPGRMKKSRKQSTEFDQKAFLYATAGGGKLF
jgi:hypothetical protein